MAKIGRPKIPKAERRPTMTITVAPETAKEVAALAKQLHTSKGVVVDILVEKFGSRIKPGPE